MRFTLKNLRFLQYIDYQNVRKTEFLGCQSQERVGGSTPSAPTKESTAAIVAVLFSYCALCSPGRGLFDNSFAVDEVSISRGVFQGLEIMRFITEDAALAVS